MVTTTKRRKPKGLCKRGRSSKPKGVILYRGPSLIDGAPIVVVVTFESANRKTGPMAQVWILRADVHPVQAIASGADVSICGGCRHRGVEGVRTCYVNVGQAPAQVWKSWKRGLYGKRAVGSGAWARRRRVRWGAYGDPAAVPFRIAERTFGYAAGHTGYTHQWGGVGAPWVGRLQASCDSPAEAMEAAMRGWATFLVQPRGAEAPARDAFPGRTVIECLADAKGLQCVDCRICDGARAHVWIEAHGAAAAYVGGR